ncbi:substrate-binding periplasmic protein [Shewanella frigidimarina]|uniref:Amino acid ABC transporter n=1 Tax=Shewanella frigidimarina TaxID=56812 RepID=A0A106BXK8_SHEFR|nr:transporter substrate-binding domain-containing protein [Shewanella frigidimarina]KVX00464.1 amino acid ABC transporter [Shewanella frigidimarina]
MKYWSIFLLSLLLTLCYPAIATSVDPIDDVHELVEFHSQIYHEKLIPVIDSISFSTSNSIAPYFFTDENIGVQYDLLKAALNSENIDIKEIVHAPNLRAQRLVKTNKIDCMINAPDNVEGLFYTQSLLEYQNSVFSLSRNNLQIEQFNDLSALSILGFQNSTQYLGDEFKDIANANPHYSEITNQKSQVVMLFNGYVEVIVLERRIFEYYRHLLKSKLDTSIPVTEVVLFDPAQRKIACHDQIIANRVDSAITTLKQSYRYQEILDLAEQNNYQPLHQMP